MAKKITVPEPRQTKLDMVRALLMVPEGTTLAAICAATGWQAHSARAALSGLRKSGYTLERTKHASGSIYRITRVPKVSP